MYKALIIIALAGVALGNVITPRGDDSSASSTPQQISGPTTQEDFSPVYTPSKQDSELPASQFYYPTYPDYSSHSPKSDQSLLVPAVPPRQAPSTGWATTIATSLVPLGSFALSYGARAIVYAFQFVGLLFIGVALTTSICTLTPFCSITFDGLGLNKHLVKEQVAELARAYITPENVNAATILVGRALDVMAEIQSRNRRFNEAERKVMNAGKNIRRRR